MNVTDATLDLAVLALTEAPLWHDFPGSDTTGFPGVGTWLIFAVVLMPIWIMMIAWFAGEPSDTQTGLLGVTYLVGITTAMWGSMLVLTLIIGIIFYGGLPAPF